MDDVNLNNCKLVLSDGVFTLKNINTTIGFVRFNENGEVEYGGDMKYAFKPYSEFKARDKHYFSKFPVKEWEKYNIRKDDLSAFDAPDIKEVAKKKIRMYFFGYYKFWDPQENFYYCQIG